jgi:hypothetical protein
MTPRRAIWCGILVVLAWATPARAQLGSVPYTFTPGTTISSTQFNTMFSTIYANALNRTGGTLTGSLTTLGLLPTADNTSDLGSAALSYRNGWFDGTLTVATLATTTLSGALTTTSRITATVTTEQLRLAYDGSNYMSVTVASNGLTTFDGTGAGAGVAFAEVAAFTLGLKERGRTALLGEWTNQAYAAGDYTASSSTWTVDSGDVLLNRYTLIGKTVIWQINIENTDVGGADDIDALRVAVPGSLTEVAATIKRGMCGYADDKGATKDYGWWTMSAAGYVALKAFANDNPWSTTAADNTDIACTIIFEIS